MSLLYTEPSNGFQLCQGQSVFTAICHACHSLTPPCCPRCSLYSSHTDLFASSGRSQAHFCFRRFASAVPQETLPETPCGSLPHLQVFPQSRLASIVRSAALPAGEHGTLSLMPTLPLLLCLFSLALLPGLAYLLSCSSLLTGMQDSRGMYRQS